MEFQSSKSFRFKQFSVDDSQSAMKVGTDAVLLGSWTKENILGNILDIGSGSGVISLILAQKNPDATIWAVELNEEAYIQSQQNFNNSQWSNRLKCVRADIQDFAIQTPLLFDLIVCNPPFFKSDKKMASSSRKTARQEDDLSFEDLSIAIKKLLTANGKFYCILPTDRMTEMDAFLSREKLYPKEKLHLRGKESANIKRSMICYTHEKNHQIHEDELIIRKVCNEHTEEYKKLTSDFYLNY